MPYPEPLVRPMREELTRLGVTELTTPEEVDRAMDAAQEGTTLAIVNSVCGCAAANARPAVALVRNVEPRPDRAVTVFAGQDLEATARLREHMVGIPPSSPRCSRLAHLTGPVGSGLDIKPRSPIVSSALRSASVTSVRHFADANELRTLTTPASAQTHNYKQKYAFHR